MAYKRYIRRNGKLYGPYVYRSVRDEKGNVRSIYVGNAGSTPSGRRFALQPAHKNLFFVLVLAAAAAGIGMLALMQPTGLVTVQETKSLSMPLSWSVNGTEGIEIILEGEPESISVSGHYAGNGSVRIYASDGVNMYLVYGREAPVSGTPITGMATGEGGKETPDEGAAPEALPEIAEVVPADEPGAATETPSVAVPEEQAPEEVAESGDVPAAPAEEPAVIANESETQIPDEVQPELPPEGNMTDEAGAANETEFPAGDENETAPPADLKINETVEIPTNATEEPPDAGQVNETEELPANVTEEPEEPEEEPGTVYFTDVCVETCMLSGFGSNITLYVEADEGTLVYLSELGYTYALTSENMPPEFVSDISPLVIEMGVPASVDLSAHFTDPEGDALTFGYSEAGGLDILIVSGTATIAPSANFTSGNVSFFASDGLQETWSNIVIVSVAQAGNATAWTGPIYANDSDNATGLAIEGDVVISSAIWTAQEGNISSVGFMSNASGEWEGEMLEGNQTENIRADFSIGTSGQAGKDICWMQSAVDSSGRENSTMAQHCFSVGRRPFVTIHSPENTTYYSRGVDYTVEFGVETAGNSSWCNFSFDGSESMGMDQEGGTLFSHAQPNVTAGQHNVTFLCDEDGNATATDYIYFSIARPRLSIAIIEPAGDINASSGVGLNVSRGEPFAVTVEVTCIEGDCGEINVTLDPFRIEAPGGASGGNEAGGND